METSLRPTPTFNSTFYKNIYTPLSHNKHCNITWKTAHRILPTALSLYCMTVHPIPNCGQCGSGETLEHLLLDCPNIRPFWNVIASSIDKISSNQVPMTPHIQLFGYIRKKNDPLNCRLVYLLNWGSYASPLCNPQICHRTPPKEHCFDPLIIFKSTAKAHIKFQYQLAKLRNAVYYFPFDWCIGEASAKLIPDLVFTL